MLPAWKMNRQQEVSKSGSWLTGPGGLADLKEDFVGTQGVVSCPMSIVQGEGKSPVRIRRGGEGLTKEVWVHSSKLLNTA